MYHYKQGGLLYLLALYCTQFNYLTSHTYLHAHMLESFKLYCERAARHCKHLELGHIVTMVKK